MSTVKKIMVSWDAQAPPETLPPPAPLSPPQGEPPLPQSLPVQTFDLWEQYLDTPSRRNYYLNTVTGERTWKPPRMNRGVNRSSTPPPGMPSLWPGDHSSTQETQQDLPATNIQRPQSTESLSLLSKTHWSSNRNSFFSGTECGNSLECREAENPDFSPNTDNEDSTILPTQEKAGSLKKTKIAEGGRKLKKNWCTAWVVLAGNSLAFYKEIKSQTPSTKGDRPESSVDLRGALVEWTRDLSSKKNVFWLRTVTGNEYLLHAENEDYINDWYQIIHKVINDLDKENPLDHQLVYALRRTASTELLEGSGDEEEPERLDRKEGLRISLRRMGSDSSERKRVKNRIKQFISRRPPLQTLQEKGLIKDQVFGCRLDALCEREKSTVPKFVRLCIETVEQRGLDVDGIYRVSGNLAVVQKLRFIVDHERVVSSDGRYLFPERNQEDKLNLDDPDWDDIHVVTGALKLFFRELPEPLFPFCIYDDFITCVKITDAEERLERAKELVNKLPRNNHDTICVLFRHFQRVVEHTHVNRMTVQSLSIVFGPTLLRTEGDPLAMACLTVYQSQVVEMVLNDCDILFTE